MAQLLFPYSLSLLDRAVPPPAFFAMADATSAADSKFPHRPDLALLGTSNPKTAFAFMNTLASSTESEVRSGSASGSADPRIRDTRIRDTRIRGTGFGTLGLRTAQDSG